MTTADYRLIRDCLFEAMEKCLKDNRSDKYDLYAAVAFAFDDGVKKCLETETD